MVSSSSSPISMARFGSPQTLGLKQAIWLLIGMVVMLLTYSIPVQTWRKKSALLWVLAVGFCFLPLFPHVGVSAGGAKRWVNLGLVTVQAADVLFFAFTLHACRKLYEDRGRETPLRAFLKVVFLAGISAVPLLLHPDMGSTLLVLPLPWASIYRFLAGAFPWFAEGVLWRWDFPSFSPRVTGYGD